MEDNYNTLWYTDHVLREILGFEVSVLQHFYYGCQRNSAYVLRTRHPCLLSNRIHAARFTFYQQQQKVSRIEGILCEKRHADAARDDVSEAHF